MAVRDPLGGFRWALDQAYPVHKPYEHDYIDLGGDRRYDTYTYKGDNNQNPYRVPAKTSGIYNSADLNARKAAADRQMAAVKAAMKQPVGPPNKPSPKVNPSPRKVIPWTKTKEAKDEIIRIPIPPRRQTPTPKNIPWTSMTYKRTPIALPYYNSRPVAARLRYKRKKRACTKNRY